MLMPTLAISTIEFKAELAIFRPKDEKRRGKKNKFFYGFTSKDIKLI